MTSRPGGVADGADGRREGGAQDDADLPDHLLARAAQGAHVHQLARRAHEHGGALATEDHLRTRARHIHVSPMRGSFDVTHASAVGAVVDKEHGQTDASHQANLASEHTPQT